MSVCSCPSTLGCSLHSPAKFLSSPQFSRKTPAPCPITGLPMHYTDLNGPSLEAEGGKEVALVILPSACSKSVVATFEPMARVSGMRLIAMDRPGVGETPGCKLNKRLKVCTDMTFSLLEHLGLVGDKAPGHIIVIETLLSSDSYLFEYLLRLSPTSPLPKVYVISPWSPSLKFNSKNAYFQPLQLIPTALIKAEHKVLPAIIPVLNTFSPAITLSGLGWSKLRGSLPFSSYAADYERSARAQVEESLQGGYWGEEAPALIGKSVMNSDRGGFGQDYLICLARGIDTGSEWFQEKFQALSSMIAARPSSEKLSISVWWGGEDGMVPRKGQKWLNHLLKSDPETVDTKIYLIDDGNHNDLPFRKAGMGEVFFEITGKRL